MYEKQSIDLARYRLERAEGDLKTARLNLEHEMYYAAANRAYYAVFNAMRSLLALDRLDFKRHSAVIAQFRKLYLKTKILPPELSDVIRDAFRIRTSSDYDDFFIASKEEISNLVADAENFVSQTGRLLYSYIIAEEQKRQWE